MQCLFSSVDFADRSGGPSVGTGGQDLALFVSAYALDELRDVSRRPHLVAKYRLDATIVEEFIADVRSFATWLDPVPHVFDFGSDPDDAHYVDLALAADAKLIVSRDRHLLDLRAGTTPESHDFQQRFPQLAIPTPSEALALVRATQTASLLVGQDDS